MTGLFSSFRRRLAMIMALFMALVCLALPLNALGGGLLGLVKGLLLVFFAVWVLRKLQLLITPQLLEESMFLPFFVNNSPLSLLTGL